MAGAIVVDQGQLEESLQQQQAVTQQMLDVMNEKIENWVCQCFSDLRNRIIELVRYLNVCRLVCITCQSKAAKTTPSAQN